MKLANKRTRAVGVSNDQINSPGFAKPQFRSGRRVHQPCLRIWSAEICASAALTIESRTTLAKLTFRPYVYSAHVYCDMVITDRLRRRLAQTVPAYLYSYKLESTRLLIDDSLEVRGYILRFSCATTHSIDLIVKLDKYFNPREYQHFPNDDGNSYYCQDIPIPRYEYKGTYTGGQAMFSAIHGPYFGRPWPVHPPFDGLITDGSDNQTPVDPELIEQLSRSGENPRHLWIPGTNSPEGGEDVGLPMLDGFVKPTNSVAAEVALGPTTYDDPRLLRIVGGCAQESSNSMLRDSRFNNLFVGHDVQQDFGKPGEIPISDARPDAELRNFLRLMSLCSRNTPAATEPPVPLPTDPTDPPST